MYFNHTHPYQLNKPGRLDSDSVPTLQHSAAIMDFTFDPFDNYRLASGVCVQWCVCVCVCTILTAAVLSCLFYFYIIIVCILCDVYW